MRSICVALSGLVLMSWTVLASAPSTGCPDFVKKSAVLGSLEQLPVKGTVVAGRRYHGGIYTSALGENKPVMIPNTQNDVNANAVQISEDGRWLIYNAGGVHVIGIDGQHRTKLPVNSSGSEGCCAIWWNGPKGLEIVYRAPDNKVIHAIAMTWGANGPTFGTDRVIARFNNPLEFSMGVARNHMWVRINDSKFHPQFVAIPDNGNGVATEADLWEVRQAMAFGCMTTISHDGSLVCYNEGYLQWCACLADEFCLMRHKSFVLLPFKEKSEPVIPWDTLVKVNGVSVNWAPEKFVMIDSNNLGSDFKDWNFTNDSTYIAGDLMGQKVGADSGSIWLVHWPTNTWTKVLGTSKDTLLGFGSVWIDKSVGTLRPSHGIRGTARSAPAADTRYLVDIRGRIVSHSGRDLSTLTPGIYYTVVPGKAMRRIVVGR